MQALYVAAGGGGDGIAALAIARRMSKEAAPLVASYSWDRFVLDPAPGPRQYDDFDDLIEHARGCWEVTARTRLRSGAESTLTIGARHTEARWFLLDPSRGAVGVAEQLAAIMTVTDAQTLTAVDVGGDILAHGDEPSLRSPLADSLTLAAIAAIDRPTTIAVAGPGLDGELPAQLIHARCHALGASTLPLTMADIEPDLRMLQQHPSEATTLLAAALAGIHGRAEIRDNGLHVVVEAGSASTYLVAGDVALTANPLAQALRRSTSLAEAEELTINRCGRSELAYERRKAADATRDRAADIDDDELLRRIDSYAHDALRRGSDLATFRRITDAVGLRRYDPQRLRQALQDAADPRLPLVRLTRFPQARR